MGCGESKHVASGNTISRKNSRAGSKWEKTSETFEETSKNDSNTSSLVKEEGKNVNQDSGAENSRAVADGKGIAESKELKKEQNVELDKEKKTGIVKENEEHVEGISGRSEAANESLSNEDVKPAEALEDKKLSEETKEETMEDKELAEDTKEVTVQEIKLAEGTKEETKGDTVEDQKLAEEKKEETANGKPETVNEENLVEGTETAETTEAKVSTPVEKQVLIIKTSFGS
ncbi:hypothetical protein REPUB_Repub15cG0026100 [Reevesia pubescens]